MKIKLISILLISCMLAGIMASCAGTDPGDVSNTSSGDTGYSNIRLKEADLMAAFTPSVLEKKDIDSKFIEGITDFYIDLFKNSIESGKNSLVSPLSVLLALAMTANGADEKTLEEMEKTLAGEISLDDLNKYLAAYTKALPSTEKSKFGIANSIWFRNDGGLDVKGDFLQKNADFYNAAAYKMDFSDPDTINAVNGWVGEKTDGMIDKIIDQISADTVMYLINAIVFDAEWETPYEKSRDGRFNSIDGEKQDCTVMTSEETKYISDDRATGFIKDYSGGHYSFAAILPNEGVSIDEYINGLDNKNFLQMLTSSENAYIYTSMPKFEYEYKIKMNEILKDMGIKDAFDSGLANLSRLGSSPLGNLYIGEVLHKTYISVSEKGTKAAAVTKVEVEAESAPQYDHIINIDRPFLYAIIDNSTGLPIFLGTVNSLK